jgi:hypothetical protein
MTTPRIAAAFAVLSTIVPTQVLAQSFSEPAAFQAQHPDRDVLNGGALTPAARAAAGLDNLSSAYGAVGIPNPVPARSIHRRRR